MSDNMNYLYTAGAYAALIGAGYAVYQMSTSKTRRRIATQTKPSKTTDAEPRKEDRKKKQRMETFSSDAQEASKKAAKADKVDTPSQSWANIAAQGTERDDEVNNREFAKQLAKAQEGHKLAKKSDSGAAKQSQKSVKQSKANKIGATSNNDSSNNKAASATSDGDNDVSPAVSPEVKAADPGGVADMLEPAPAAPSILRLTNTEEKKKPAKAKAPEQVETKKQRQNRKKAEAAKAAREEAEVERKGLEEKQRRQARIAEGRAAKDGSQFTNASVSKWNQGAPNGAGKSSNEQAPLQPLDTFEKPSEKAASTQQSSTTKSSDIEDNWVHAALPSEEEQLEMLKDNADEWNTVKNKGSKKPKKTADADASADAAAPVAAPAPVQQAKVAKKPAKPAASQEPRKLFRSSVY